MTTMATDWLQLEGQKSRTSGSLLSAHDPILGEIEIIRYQGKKLESTHTLHPRTHTLVFGRKSEKGIVQLPHSHASSIHFQIFKRDDRYYIEDLGSKNGTFVNGERLRTRVPIELFFRDTIDAAGSHFMVWDERPQSPMQQLLGTTQTLTGPVIELELDIPLPDDLETLHQELMLRILYFPKEGGETSCLCRVQAYYPLQDILSALVRGLDLPKVKYYLTVDGDMLDHSSTPLALEIQDGATLRILPEREAVDEWTLSLNDALNTFDHCETHLMSIGGQRQYREGFAYVSFEQLFNRVYQTRFKQTPPAKPLPIFLCPKCKQQHDAQIKVGIESSKAKKLGVQI